eukprot:6840266-Pyramimonas_sp.AAC.1
MCLKHLEALVYLASERPRMAQGASEIAPRQPKRPPREPQTSIQEDPKIAQEAPKIAAVPIQTTR